jgi:hypothetical protein
MRDRIGKRRREFRKRDIGTEGHRDEGDVSPEAAMPMKSGSGTIMASPNYCRHEFKRTGRFCSLCGARRPSRARLAWLRLTLRGRWAGYWPLTHVQPIELDINSDAHVRGLRQASENLATFSRTVRGASKQPELHEIWPGEHWNFEDGRAVCTRTFLVRGEASANQATAAIRAKLRSWADERRMMFVMFIFSPLGDGTAEVGLKYRRLTQSECSGQRVCSYCQGGGRDPNGWDCCGCGGSGWWTPMRYEDFARTATVSCETEVPADLVAMRKTICAEPGNMYAHLFTQMFREGEIFAAVKDPATVAAPGENREHAVTVGEGTHVCIQCGAVRPANPMERSDPRMYRCGTCVFEREGQWTMLGHAARSMACETDRQWSALGARHV